MGFDHQENQAVLSPEVMDGGRSSDFPGTTFVAFSGLHGILIPADGSDNGGTAAAPDSWGLIKASLSP